ncbi:hypothetical protein GBAR_LOCUS16188, partial [Geodia barretti]
PHTPAGSPLSPTAPVVTGRRSPRSSASAPPPVRRSRVREVLVARTMLASESTLTGRLLEDFRESFGRYHALRDVALQIYPGAL